MRETRLNPPEQKAPADCMNTGIDVAYGGK